MEILKKLTNEQCVEIAKIVEPSVKWKVITSENKWDGIDLINEECQEHNAKNIFQIDFIDEKDLSESFRICENFNVFDCFSKEIEEYLIQIGEENGKTFVEKYKKQLKIS